MPASDGYPKSVVDDSVEIITLQNEEARQTLCDDRYQGQNLKLPKATKVAGEVSEVAASTSKHGQCMCHKRCLYVEHRRMIDAVIQL